MSAASFLRLHVQGGLEAGDLKFAQGGQPAAHVLHELLLKIFFYSSPSVTISPA
jgi:hypothetical protein